MKTNQYFVKPASEGLKVPNPDTKAHLLAEGEVVVWNSYWQRRLDAKEIVRSDVPKTDKQTQEESKKTKSSDSVKVEKENKKDQGGN